MQDIESNKIICSFLEKKVALFNQYLSITERMKETLRNKEESKLEGFLSKRQDCISKIERIDLSIKKIVKAGLSNLANISNRYKMVIDSYIADIRSIMTTVDLMDRELMVIINTESRSLKTGLLRFQHSKQAARGYKPKVGYSSRFLDIKS